MLPYDEFMALPPLIEEGVYDVRDSILYALGLGVGSSDPTSPQALRYVYEDGLEALPTMAVVIGNPGFYLKDPKYQVDWKKILHGEQRLTIHNPLPSHGKVKSVLTFDEVYDKGAGKGALLFTTRKIYDLESDTLLASLGSTSFMRGDGGQGGQTNSAPKPPAVPDRAPDETFAIATRIDQALIYRLSADMNPLHIDPDVAKSAGFEKPILHGLCTYGVAGYAVLKMLCDGQAGRLKQFDCRFSSPVYPGDEIQIDVWRTQPGEAAMQARVAARNQVVLSNGFVRFETD